MLPVPPCTLWNQRDSRGRGGASCCWLAPYVLYAGMFAVPTKSMQLQLLQLLQWPVDCFAMPLYVPTAHVTAAGWGELAAHNHC